MTETTRDPNSLLTAGQRLFADSLRDLFERTRVTYLEQFRRNRAEAWYRFHIETVDSRLSVFLDVVGDVFVFTANEAELRRDLSAWRDDTSGWTSECLRIVAVLLRNDLRIRVRRTLFGRIKGAIWLPDDQGNGSWNGDLAACRGHGRESVFPKEWYRRRNE